MGRWSHGAYWWKPRRAKHRYRWLLCNRVGGPLNCCSGDYGIVGASSAPAGASLAKVEVASSVERGNSSSFRFRREYCGGSTKSTPPPPQHFIIRTHRSGKECFVSSSLRARERAAHRRSTTDLHVEVGFLLWRTADGRTWTACCSYYLLLSCKQPRWPTIRLDIIVPKFKNTGVRRLKSLFLHLKK